MLKVLPCVLWMLLIGASGVVSTIDNPISHSCSLNSHEKRLYVSTVDGSLTALNTNGERLWTYTSLQPLFKSTLSYSEASEAVPNLIPGLNRELYHWDGSKLHTLPFTADDLIESAHFTATRDTALAGSRTKEVVGINLQNGKHLYECTPERCHRYDNNSLIQRIDVLKVGVSRVTVREASELTGEEMWNFTVGDLQLSLVEGVEDEFSCHTSAHLPWELQADTLTGVLSAVDRQPSQKKAVVWQVQLSAPIVDMWLHDGGRLERVQLVSESAHFNTPSLMLLQYNNQYYIQPVVNGRGVAVTMGDLLAQGHVRDVSSTPKKSSDIEVVDQLLVVIFECSKFHAKESEGLYYHLSVPLEPDIDSVAGSAPGTKALTLYNDGFMQMCTAGPTGLAVYFYLDVDQYYNDCGSGEDNESGNACSSPRMEEFVQQETLLSTMWSLTQSAIKYILFASFVAILSHIHHINPYKRLVSGNIDVDLCPVRTVQGNGAVQRLSSESSFSPSSTETLSSSNPSMETLSEPRVIARFDSDYELRGQLGKGGFGIVYHVQNKLDGGEYAIKRIKLPTNKSAKDKVMREVHALARLEHPRIVRYFHSWVEKAPAGWTEIEEWMPLSRGASCGGDAQSRTSSEAVTTNTSQCQSQTEESSRRPLINLSHINNNTSLLSSGMSPCPSFNSLSHSAIHSVLPPVFTADSRSSSFVIEFQAEEGQCSRSSSQLGTQPHQGGCFSRDLLSRDDLSVGSSSTDSTEDRERRDSVADLMVEPPTYLFIQMQLCQKESLKDWLAKNIYNRNKQTVMHFFEQTLEAVLYVHNKGMMHRDLKPSNIFFSLEGQVKVGDFGLVTGSAFANFGSSYLALKSLGDDHKQHTGNIGTHFYISPEQLSGTKYNNKVDIFALGVIFFELLYPFSTQMERVKELDNLRNRKFPLRFETHLSLEADFVEWLMTPSVSKRPSAQEVADSQRLATLRETYARAEVKLVPKL